jgi:DNA invertase Pin-like site-specific DNA recombinase
MEYFLVKVAIYARVSTEEQHKENQIPVLQEWADRRGWEVVQIYAENA